MSIEAGLQPKPRPPLTADEQVLLPPAPDGRLGENIAKLESDLAREREERQEERFLWIAGASILLDYIGYGLIKDFAAFVPMVLLQLILLVVLAKRLGVDWAVQAIGWLMFQMRQKPSPEQKPRGKSSAPQVPEPPVPPDLPG